MPRLTGILETSLYVADLERSVKFYRDVLGCDVVEEGGKLWALRLADQQILLLCESVLAAALRGAHQVAGGR